MDKHIILKLLTLEINERHGGKERCTKVEEKHIEQDIVQVTQPKEVDPYYEVLWLTGC